LVGRARGLEVEFVSFLHLPLQDDRRLSARRRDERTEHKHDRLPTQLPHGSLPSDQAENHPSPCRRFGKYRSPLIGTCPVTDKGLRNGAARVLLSPLRLRTLGRSQWPRRGAYPGDLAAHVEIL